MTTNILPSLTREGTKTHDYATPPSTPNSLSTTANELLSEIRQIHHELTLLPNLAPGEKINALLTRLVKLCITPFSPELSDYFFNIEGVDKLCFSLRILCATAEGELEKYWAQRMLESAAKSSPSAAMTNDLLQQFPYYENYVDLSRLEALLLSAFLPRTEAPKNMAFIGSGPLPLTSLCLLEHFPETRICNIDRDCAALAVSKKLTDTLGYGQRMTFSCEDVDPTSHPTSTNWKEFDVVFFAALVGMDTDTKHSILSSLAKIMRSGALVVARSARGMRGVLYPVLELSDALGDMGFEVLAEVHPWTSVVNSVVVLRVKDC